MRETVLSLVIMVFLGLFMIAIAHALATDDDDPCDDEDDTVDMPPNWRDQQVDTIEIRRTHPR